MSVTWAWMGTSPAQTCSPIVPSLLSIWLLSCNTILLTISLWNPLPLRILQLSICFYVTGNVIAATRDLLVSPYSDPYTYYYMFSHDHACSGCSTCAAGYNLNTTSSICMLSPIVITNSTTNATNTTNGTVINAIKSTNDQNQEQVVTDLK